MPDNLSVLLENYHESIQEVFGKHLEKMVLYGSYTSGDFKRESDMDIMILADVQPDHLLNLF